MPEKQPAKRTPVSAQEVLNALAQACVTYFHNDPNPTALLVLLAQSAGETGWWGQMWNNNLGNYKAVPSNGKTDWFFLKCWEMVKPPLPPAWASDARISVEGTPAADGRLKVWFAPDHPAGCFASFPTLSDGAHAYLVKLVERFSSPNDKGKKDAWYWATQGDIAKFTYALHAQGYFTADPEEYMKLTLSCRSRLNSMGLDFTKLSGPPAEGPMPTVHPSLFGDGGDDGSNA